MRFTYQAGAQPLAGYTIQRGIHRGGFGEVYFASSVGGKEVALKLLHREEQDVEIRGVTQCLNLKHPNLINLFDLKMDSHGDHWVVMEYVAGSSLEDVLASFPNGLRLSEVQEWLSGLVAGVAHLHERGIVHRDLKPANVYRENGIVKVGDVGLSKRLDSDNDRRNTQSVGTVYYMAPEVANGQYGPEVDVYSLGVMLYEMLTGKLPFDGESTAEVLMKHLTAQPDLSPVPKELRPMVARALEKDPRRRTPTVRSLEQEFLKACHSPSATPWSAKKPIEPIPPTMSFRQKLRELRRMRREIRCSRRQQAQLDRQARETEKRARRSSSVYPIPEIRPWNEVLPELSHSLGRSAIIASLLSLGIAIVLNDWRNSSVMPEIEQQTFFVATSMVVTWLLLIGQTWAMNRQSRRRHYFFTRILIGAVIGVFAHELCQFLLVEIPRSAHFGPQLFSTILRQPLNDAGGTPKLAGFVSFFSVWLGIRNWSRETNPYRRRRLSMGLTAASGGTALLASMFFSFPQWYAVLWAVTASMTLQLSSKWTPKSLLAGKS